MFNLWDILPDKNVEKFIRRFETAYSIINDLGSLCYVSPTIHLSNHLVHLYRIHSITRTHSSNSKLNFLDQITYRRFAQCDHRVRQDFRYTTHSCADHLKAFTPTIKTLINHLFKQILNTKKYILYPQLAASKIAMQKASVSDVFRNTWPFTSILRTLWFVIEPRRVTLLCSL